MSKDEHKTFDLGHVRRIALFRALQLGDLIVAIPAIRALRTHFPEAEVTFIGLPWAETFVQRYPRYIDRFIEFAGYPGIKEVPVNPERISAFLVEQTHDAFDLVVQMHGSGQSSNPFVFALNGRVNVGYYEGIRPTRLTFGLPYPHTRHEIWRNLGLAELVGCTDLNPQLEFPLYERDYAEAAILLRDLSQANRPWIGLHPGSRSPARRWPAEYFACLADDLAERFGAQIILTGSSDERAIVQAVSEQMHMPALNLVGKTSLGGLGALISKMDLFISNDTGPAHIAHALNNPSITLFGPADYERWAALEHEILHLTLRHPVSCSPCGNWECPIDHRCLRQLMPAEVMQFAQHLLHKGRRVIPMQDIGDDRSKEEEICDD